jgi:hypothetical protein
MESSSTIVEPSDDRQESLRPSLEDEDEFDSVPKTGLKDVEFSSPDDNPSGSSNGDSGDLELNPAGDSLDNSDLPSPSDADVLDAGWKIQWNPKYEREI